MTTGVPGWLQYIEAIYLIIKAFYQVRALFKMGAALLRRPHGNDFRRLSLHLSSPVTATF
jgi:hypothetical protein